MHRVSPRVAPCWTLSVVAILKKMCTAHTGGEEQSVRGAVIKPSGEQQGGRGCQAKEDD